MLTKIVRAARRLAEIPSRLDAVQRALGRIERRQNLASPDLAFREAEFQVSSQWGEDGLIQYLLSRVPIETRVFVEFGVEAYAEANTRFLLQNDNWSGLVMDGSAANIAQLRAEPLYWRFNLKARCAFVNAANINELITSEGIRGDIGLLSLDIDGNDYWVWKAIEAISPRIVICEFNALFGPDAQVSIPYDPEFTRAAAHHSHLYYGASLSALAYLAAAKGYSLVGTNGNSNNAFFVRNDLHANVAVVTPARCYRAAAFREARDANGSLLYVTQQEAIGLVAELEVENVTNGQRVRIADLPTRASR